jgi:hypothetical protein
MRIPSGLPIQSLQDGPNLAARATKPPDSAPMSPRLLLSPQSTTNRRPPAAFISPKVARAFASIYSSCPRSSPMLLMHLPSQSYRRHSTTPLCLSLLCRSDCPLPGPAFLASPEVPPVSSTWTDRDDWHTSSRRRGLELVTAPMMTSNIG